MLKATLQPLEGIYMLCKPRARDPSVLRHHCIEYFARGRMMTSAARTTSLRIRMVGLWAFRQHCAQGPLRMTSARAELHTHGLT